MSASRVYRPAWARRYAVGSSADGAGELVFRRGPPVGSPPVERRADEEVRWVAARRRTVRPRPAGAAVARPSSILRSAVGRDRRAHRRGLGHAVDAPPRLADEVRHEQEDARDEDELRPGEAERLDLVAADELDDEPEHRRGEQVGLQQVALDRSPASEPTGARRSRRR